MPSYKAPRRDMQFVLYDLLKVHEEEGIKGYDEVNQDLLDAIIDGGAKISEELLTPLNLPGDEAGCTLENGVVTVPPGFKEAYDQYCEGGWVGLSGDARWGGQGLPAIMKVALEEMQNSANMAFAMYVGLSTSAIKCIEQWGTDEQRETWLPKMNEGTWSGTMNLTEPHCGTDLGMLRTKAEPQADGSYKISGTKIFISAGEHEMTDNIVHLVLARLPDAPAGVKGISLFIVPKYLVNDDGSIGEKNSLGVGSIEEKMGIHGNSTCVMNYDGATGYLIGPEHKGLRAMFTMMLIARVGVGMMGLCQAEAASQNAAEYARDRIQGRSLTGAKNKDKPADPIIVHPDVRRMLMQNRAFTEGARALSYWITVLGDRSQAGEDEKGREEAEVLMEILTPILKAFVTDRGFQATVDAQQCLGGHGYVREWGMEQFVRDARIAQIYEGANGVQALDLVGRQLPKRGGQGIRELMGMIGALAKEYEGHEEFGAYAAKLAQANGDLQKATMWLMQNAMQNPDHAGAASTDYLYICGWTLFGYWWLKMAAAAREQLDAGAEDKQFYENKLITARFYFEREMNKTAGLLANIETGADNLMALDAEAF